VQTTAAEPKPSQLRGEAHGDTDECKEERREEVFGPEVFPISGEERGDGDAGDEGGQAAIRAQRQDRDESQAGDCHWALGGAKRGKESTREELVERRWESELRAQLAVLDLGFEYLRSKFRVVARNSSVNVEGKAMPGTYDSALFDGSFAERAAFVRTDSIEDRDLAAHVGYAQGAVMDNELTHLIDGGELRLSADTDKLGHGGLLCDAQSPAPNTQLA